MIQQISVNENPEAELNLSFVRALQTLGISKLLAQCGVKKSTRLLKNEQSGEKRSAFEIFQFLLLMVFQGCNLYRFLGSKKQDIACSKSTYHRFLSNEHYNWRKFVTLLAVKVTSSFNRLTREDRFHALVLDDSVIPRERSKKVELLAFIFDHVCNKAVKGFNLLTLGWTDGFSFIPVAFNMLTSAKQDKRLNDVNPGIDKRTNGYKNRVSAMLQKPDAAIEMIHNALSAGVEASFVLMDTWFTNEPFIRRILDEGLDVIGMLKDNKQKYHCYGKLYGIEQLALMFARKNVPGEIFGSVIVRTKKKKIPVKLVFLRNRNKRSEYIVILSTDCSLSDAEIIRRYSYRWQIECCFKVCKSLLKLGREFQPVNYDTTVSSTALVFTRFILLEWIRRQNSDAHTLGEIFFYCYDDVRDIELSEALDRLVTIMTDGIVAGTIQIDNTVRQSLLEWYVSQPSFIQQLCCRQMIDAGFISEEQEHSTAGMSMVA